MKDKMLLMLAIGLFFAVAFGESHELATNVRQPLLEIMDSYGRDELRPIILLNDWQGFNMTTNASFARLSQLVTNRWEEVLYTMPEISTNEAERLIVMASGVVRGEDRFISCIISVADMVLSNKLTSAELRFYKTRCSIADHYAASSLVRRYQEPAISNLIMKLNAAGCYPQGVSDIFSGDAKELYLDAVHDGLVGP